MQDLLFVERDGSRKLSYSESKEKECRFYDVIAVLMSSFLFLGTSVMFVRWFIILVNDSIYSYDAVSYDFGFRRQYTARLMRSSFWSPNHR